MIGFASSHVFLSSGQSSHTSCDKVAGTAENPSPSKSHASDQVTPRTPGPEAPWRLLEGAAPDLGILGARLAAIVRSIVSLDTHLLRKGMSRNICSRCNGCEFQGRSHRSETWETKPILTRDTQKPLRGFLRRWEGDDAVSVTPPDVISGDTQRTNTGVQLNRVIEQGLPAQERGMTVIVSLQSWSFDLSFLLFLVRNQPRETPNIASHFCPSRFLPESSSFVFLSAAQHCGAVYGFMS